MYSFLRLNKRLILMTTIEKAASALQKLYAKRSALDKQIVAAEKKLTDEAKAAAKTSNSGKKEGCPKAKSKAAA